MKTKERPWRCRGCDAVLGLIRGGALVIQEPRASFFVALPVVAVCTCLERNELGSVR